MKRSRFLALGLVFVFAFMFALSFSVTEVLQAKASPCCDLPCPPGCSGGYTQGKWHPKYPICIPAEYGHICWDPTNCQCY
jgi:hypothetical protein